MKIRDILNGKVLNYNFFGRLKDRAKSDNENLGVMNTLTNAFYNGNQWDSLKLFSAQANDKNTLLYNTLGQSVWYFNRNFPKQESKYIPRIVNLIKPYTDTQVAAHAEVDPKPLAVHRATYLENEDKNLNIINIALNQIFFLNNNFNQVFQVAVRKAYLTSYHVVQIYVDEINMDRQANCPIKFRQVNMEDFWVDPEATNINTAQYMIQKLSIPKLVLEEKYDYTYKTDSVENVDEFDLETVLVYWLRVETQPADKKTLKDNGIPKVVWLSIPTLDGKWLKRRDVEGKVIDGIENYVVKTLPFVLYRTNIEEKFHGGVSKGAQAIEPQILMNRLATALDLNTRMYIDPVVVGDGDVKVWDKANKPGGAYMVTKGKLAWTPVTVNLLDPAKSNATQQNIKEMFDHIYGNVDMMEGHNPQGVYGASHLENLLKLANLKPRLIEHGLLDTTQDLAEKALRVWGEFMGDGGVVLFDPNHEDNVILYSDMIEEELYQVNVIITDANLMTPKAKFNQFIELLQYTHISDNMLPIDIFRLADEIMPGLYPKKQLDRIEESSEKMAALKNIQLDAQIKQTKMQMQQMKGQAGGMTIEKVTEWAYQQLDKNPAVQKADVDRIIEQSDPNNLEAIVNSLEQLFGKTEGITNKTRR